MHLLDRIPDDTIIMIGETGEDLALSTQLETIVVEETIRTTYNPPNELDNKKTLTIFLIKESY